MRWTLLLRINFLVLNKYFHEITSLSIVLRLFFHNISISSKHDRETAASLLRRRRQIVKNFYFHFQFSDNFRSLCAQSRLFNLLDWKVRLARYFTYYIYLFSFPSLICPFSYVAHVVGGSSQKHRVHSRYRNYRNQFRKCTHFRYPNDNQLITPFQWLLYQKIMPVAYRLSETVRKINNWPRKKALRANVKYWGLSLNQGSRSSKQPARQGLSIL